MESTEYLEGIKKERKLTYQQLADKTQTTPQYWHLVFRRGEPLGVDLAKRLIKQLELDSQGDILLNLIFRERFLRFLDKHGMGKRGPTPQVQKFIKVIKTWNPRTSGILDILCQLFNIPAPQSGLPIANDNSIFLDMPLDPDLQCLTPGVRKHFLLSDPAWLFCSKDSEYHVVILKNALVRS